MGERKDLSLQKSTEYGFIRDEIAIKANMRLDIKKALGKALVIGTSGAMTRSKSKVRYSGYKEVEKEDESSNSGSIYMPSTTPEKVVVYQMTVICSLGGGINE